MTKLRISGLLILFTCLFARAQSHVVITVIDTSTGLPASNQFIAFQIYPTGNIPPSNAQQEGLTDQNGNLSMQYVSNLSGNYTVIAMGYDCNNQYITDTSFHDFNQSPNFNDTLFLNCTVQIECAGKLNFTPDPADSLTLIIELDTSYIKNLPPDHQKYIGDWTIAQENPHVIVDSLYANGQQSISYTFPGPGEYSICNLFAAWDSTLMITRPCLTMVCDTINVPMPDTSFCQASYSGDSATSNAGLITLLNTSAPEITNSAYSTLFIWDFGDGDTSHQAFPIHVYDSTGVYELCLTVTSISQFQNSCTSTYCDSVGVDSLGNVIMKKAGQGFTLQVIDPKTISTPEYEMIPELHVFPNPAGESLFVQSPQLAQRGSYISIYDLRGKLVYQEKIESDTEKQALKLDVSYLPTGSYILQVSSPMEVQASTSIKILKN